MKDRWVHTGKMLSACPKVWLYLRKMKSYYNRYRSWQGEKSEEGTVFHINLKKIKWIYKRGNENQGYGCSSQICEKDLLCVWWFLFLLKSLSA